jgi:membrane protease YdiL (CAAX protease family)
VKSSFTVCGVATIAIVPLIAATWLIPPGFPHLLRQMILCAWGVGTILAAERRLFSGSYGLALRRLGFVPARAAIVITALLVSLPMWIFLPLFAWISDADLTIRPDWLVLLAGVVLVNGITEEVIHRGFVFGHLREGRSFASAATISALLFAAQHLYLPVTMGWAVGLSSVLLAALLAYPMARVFERGGRSLAGPAILHTSTNTPAIILALPEELMATAIVMHMGVILVSVYLVFLVRAGAPSSSGKAVLT